MRFRGNVLKDGQVVVAGVSGEIIDRTIGMGPVTETGWLEVPVDAAVPSRGQEYELRLDGGQSAPILVERVKFAANKNTIVEFILNGFLQ